VDDRCRAATIVTLGLFLLAALPPHAAFAQAQPADEPPPRLEASAQAALLATTGNASSQALGLGGEFVWRPMPWVLRGKAAFAQTKTDGDLSARATLGLFRSDWFITPRTSLYDQYDFLRDLFAGVEQRHTITGGIAYRIVDRPPHRLTIDGGLGYEHEDRLNEESENLAIGTAGLAYRWEISATSQLTEDLRYTQAFESIDNWKLDHIVTLTAAITSVISLKLSNNVRYANAPVPGFESTDTITSVALVWTMKRPGP
jgi:putative salt-induced outer membrane protein